MSALSAIRNGWRQIGRVCSPELSRLYASSSSDQLNMIKTLRERSGAPMSDVRAALMATNFDMDEALSELRKRGLAASKTKATRNAAQGLVGIAAGVDSAAIVEVNSETDFVARNDKFVELVGQVATTAASLQQCNEDGSIGLQTLLDAHIADATSVGSAIDEVAAVVREKMGLRRAVRIAVDGGVVGAYLHASPAPGVGRMGALVGMKCKKAALDGGLRDEARKLANQVAMHVVALRPAFLDRDVVPEPIRQKEAVMLHSQVEQSGKPPEVVEKIVLGRLNKFYQESCLLEQTFVMDDTKKVQKVLDDFSKGFGCSLYITNFTRMQVGEGLGEDVNALGQATEMAKTMQDASKAGGTRSAY